MSNIPPHLVKLQANVDPAWLERRSEEIIDPSLPIIDPHHHLWDIADGRRYLFDDVLADFQSGHNVVASVFVEAEAMYDADRPAEMRPVGETEFANGVAARSASGRYGDIRVCAGIVGHCDIGLGSRVEPVIEAHLKAAGRRFRGIRPTIVWHEDAQVRPREIGANLLVQKPSLDAIAVIARHDLTFDIWAFFTQLDEVVQVCKRFPGLKVIVNHVGGPIGIGPYAGHRDDMMKVWRSRVAALAECPNAFMKIGGMGMRYAGLRFREQPLPPSSDMLVESWKPYVEFCIETLGANRCMFESNFPVDKALCSYHVLWNAFKKMAAGCSDAERHQLFFGTAKQVYRLAVAPKVDSKASG